MHFEVAESPFFLSQIQLVARPHSRSSPLNETGANYLTCSKILLFFGHFNLTRNKMQTAATNITHELRMVWNNNLKFSWCFVCYVFFRILRFLSHATFSFACYVFFRMLRFLSHATFSFACYIFFRMLRFLDVSHAKRQENVACETSRKF